MFIYLLLPLQSIPKRNIAGALLYAGPKARILLLSAHKSADDTELEARPMGRNLWSVDNV
jgi:hypothetical protein